jgi:hypothetical protein
VTTFPTLSDPVIMGDRDLWGAKINGDLDAIATWGAAVDSALAGKSQMMTALTQKSTNYSANPNEFVPFDCTSARVLTLPNAPADQTRVGTRVDTGTGGLTVNRAGSDTFQGGGTSFTLPYAGEAVTFTYRASDHVWVVSSHDWSMSGLLLATALAYRPMAPDGYLAANYDPLAIAGTFTLPTSGVLNLLKLTLPTAQTITNIAVYVGTAGATLTSGQNLLGLYDSTGTLRGQTADQTTAWGTSGYKTAALTSPYAAAAGVYYVGILAKGTTTPAFARTQILDSGLYNGTATGAGLRFASSGSALTALPGSVTLSGIAASANTFWAGLT